MSNYEKQQQTLNDFPFQFKSIILSTMNDDGTPLVSYAPMIFNNHHWYILISQMAPHTKNLLRHPQGAGLLVEDESLVASIFFRKRLSFSFSVHLIGSSSELTQLFEARHGEMVKMLASMDFQYWQLLPGEGTFVIGPGQAFTVSPELIITKQNGAPGGHNRT